MLANVTAFYGLCTRAAAGKNLTLPSAPTPCSILTTSAPASSSFQQNLCFIMLSPIHIDPVVPLDNVNSITFEPLSVQTPSSSQTRSVFSDSALSTISISTSSPLPNELRPPPQLTSNEEEKVLSFFRASILLQRNKDTKSWVWKYGLDIQDEGTRRWVCMVCIKKNSRVRPMTYIDKTLAMPRHLINDHHIADPTGKLESRGTKRKFQSIADHFALDTTNPPTAALPTR